MYHVPIPIEVELGWDDSIDFRAKGPSGFRAKKVAWRPSHWECGAFPLLWFFVESAMSQDKWTAVDRYIAQMLIPADAALESALAASEAASLPPINVSPNQGKLLQLLARSQDAQQILEIGTLGGYSTIWLARGLAADGRLITLEADPNHAAVARANIANAGLDAVVELRLGLALETLPKLAAEGRGPFDLIFIDADKPSNPEYFAWALKLSRRGSLIIVDNVVRGGAVIDAASSDTAIQGVRRLNELLAAETRVSATAIQTVGSKGYDGFAIALVTGEI
jgi:predicted O-methyltransferase YrrM